MPKPISGPGPSAAELLVADFRPGQLANGRKLTGTTAGPMMGYATGGEAVQPLASTVGRVHDGYFGHAGPVAPQAAHAPPVPMQPYSPTTPVRQDMDTGTGTGMPVTGGELWPHVRERPVGSLLLYRPLHPLCRR